ncbi:hypothetical protein NC661_08610 [Aquibacillus koreensis]|uniref:Uncharacterized protein n=1 Tax=Aquibacillus koreensis TaxID=279446 RepID=A0A9X3WLG0_9BACI|nr:hypothetical protein [Aquibacillus koreensis]MCT2535970.1 hypothetical protein [Aquibacillus koreensis]MDC3420426.1 hypothetical protein [Aquibacillus koreensis]
MFEGAVFSGEMDHDAFLLTQVKSISTQSILSKHQLNNLFTYLSHNAERNESCTITVNDQLPLLLSNEDVHALLKDITTIMNEVNQP